MIKASSDMGQLCNLGSGWCELKRKSCERACWELCPFVQDSCLSSVAWCACTWLCALLTLTLPWLPGLTRDPLNHCKLVWWVQDCGWPRLMPPDLLCLLRGCGTVVLSCEVLACLAAPMAPSSPHWAEVLLLPGMFLFVSGGVLFCWVFSHKNNTLYWSVFTDSALCQNGNCSVFWWC